MAEFFSVVIPVSYSLEQYFREEIRIQLVDEMEQHKSRAAVALAKIATLKEEQRLIDLRRESLLVESKLREQRRQVRWGDGPPRPTTPTTQQVDNAFHRLTYKP